jgi:hypothetical protein
VTERCNHVVVIPTGGGWYSNLDAVMSGLNGVKSEFVRGRCREEDSPITIESRSLSGSQGEMKIRCRCV